MRRVHLGILAGIACACSANLSTQAAVVVATDRQTNDTNSLPHTYVVSTTDLINGLAPSASAGNFTAETTGGTPVLTNGAFPTPITRDAGGPFQFAAFATGGNTGGTSVTYTLGTASNVTSVVVYGGWQDGGRDQQSYTLSYSTAVAPGTFIPLTTVNFNPPDPTGDPQVTRVTISDDTLSTLALNVAALRFDFNATENGYSGYAEIDVLGSPVPEPASLGVLGLGALGLLARGRRSR